jgi:hypothetical protein
MQTDRFLCRLEGHVAGFAQLVAELRVAVEKNQYRAIDEVVDLILTEGDHYVGVVSDEARAKLVAIAERARGKLASVNKDQPTL